MLVIEVRSNQMPDGGIVTTFTDVTPSVEAEEALERANETLERRVHERTEELTQLNIALAHAKGEADAGRLPAVPVLMLLDRRPDVFLARRSGADGFVLKPLDSLRLRKAVTTLLAGGTYEDPTGAPIEVPGSAPVG